MSCLYPTYVRGQAFLAAGQGSTAAAEFQKVIDHSGCVSSKFKLAPWAVIQRDLAEHARISIFCFSGGPKADP
jgi:hypothetical protein